MFNKFRKSNKMGNNKHKKDLGKQSTIDMDKKIIAEEQQEIENELKTSEAQLKEDEKKSEENVSENLSETDKKLADTEEKLSEVNDKYVRLAAEFDNYRRRVAKEKLELISTASEDVIKGILPVLDDCSRALQVLKDANADNAVIEGTELILNKLNGFLKSKGLVMIEARGKDFNTDDMEAVTQFPTQDEQQKGKVIDVVQEGYTLNGKVIRFAKVVVGA